MLIFNKHIAASLLQITDSFNIAYCLPFRLFRDYYLDLLQKSAFLVQILRENHQWLFGIKGMSLVWTLGVDAVFLDRSQMPSVPIMTSLLASTHNINQTHQSNTDKCQLPQ